MSKLHPYRSLRPLFWTILVVWLVVLVTVKLVQLKKEVNPAPIIATNSLNVMSSHGHSLIFCEP